MKKIFIVEDNPVFAEQIKKVLEGEGNFQFFLYSTVERALGNVSEEPDYIILDHFLDKAHGIDCIPIFREFTPNSRIVVVSSQSDIETFQAAMDFGADEYFFKDGLTLLNIRDYVRKTKDVVATCWFDSLINKLKHGAHNSRKVWVLEDNETTAFTIDYMLTGQDKNQLSTFTKTSDFNLALEKQKPDVLILDYQLDEVENGYDILSKVKAVSPQTKIIALSSQRDVNVALKLIHAGASYYLIKSTANLSRLAALVAAI